MLLEKSSQNPISILGLSRTEKNERSSYFHVLNLYHYKSRKKGKKMY